MLRTILSVVVGYVAIFILVFFTLAVAFMVMKADGALKPGSFETSSLWLVVSITLGFVVAAIGGFISAAIARKPSGPIALAIVVLVLGLIFAIPALRPAESEEPAVRAGDVGMMEAMQKAKQPPWFAIVNPFIGAAGVLIGSRFRRSGDAGSGGA
jgi:hypothetical protein